MKRAIFCLVISTLVGSAAEIVAWKVPLSRYAEKGLKTEGVVRRDTAPEASPFFKDGDELWDLTAVKPSNLDCEDLALDWLVWDATSGRLVAKGSWTDICEIHEIFQIDHLPRHLKLKVGIFEAAAAPPVAGAIPVSEITISVRSGRKVTATWSEGGTSLDLNAEAIIGDTNTFADGNYSGRKAGGIPGEGGFDGFQQVQPLFADCGDITADDTEPLGSLSATETT